MDGIKKRNLRFGLRLRRVGAGPQREQRSPNKNKRERPCIKLGFELDSRCRSRGYGDKRDVE